MACQRCQQEHERCTGHRKNGLPCRAWPVKGLDKCDKHCGLSAEAAREKGGRVLQRQAAEEAARTYGLPREIDPAHALLEEVHRTAGHVAWLEQIVRETDPDALVWGRASLLEKGATEFPGVDVSYAAGQSVWLELYREERRHLVRVCADALKAGVEERRVRLAESAQRETAEFMRRVLVSFGIPDTPDTWQRVREQWTPRVIEGGLAS